MRPSLPTLGAPPKKSAMGPLLGVSLLVGGLAGGIWWWKHRTDERPLPPELARLQEPNTQPLTPAEQVPTPLAPATPVEPADPGILNGVKLATVKINGPLETALVEAAGREVGPALAQVVTRSLVWWLNVPRDILRGDTLDVLYEVRNGEEPLVHAVRFSSAKTGEQHRAYRYLPEGELHPRYYQPTGEELEMRLKNSPLDDYEQVTSLLRDGRKHKGVDFKTPVGTPVKAPFTGVVTRKNWSFRGNGNCVELKESGGQGRRAFFLHLSELPKSLKVGDRFNQGALIAMSGNSGHSFAPHLHYQLMTGGDRVLDPYESHASYRRTLESAKRPGLDAEIRRLDGLMSPRVAAP